MSKDRHGWLRGALSDAGLRQKDVAAMWGCDEAVVSRFIKSGEPALTFDRALSLSSKLKMSLDELNVRLQEGLAPRTRSAGRLVPAPAPTKPVARGTDDVAGAMADAKAAVARLQELMPDAKIIFQINLGD